MATNKVFMEKFFSGVCCKGFWKKNKGQIVQNLYVIIFCKLAKVEDVF